MHRITRNNWKILVLVLVMFWVTGYVTQIVVAQENSTSSAEEPAQGSAENTVSPEQIDLERRINEKNEELKEINKKLSETEQNLVSTKQEKASLQNEIKKIENNVYQLNLNIKADGVVVEKLGFEIDSIKYDIRDIEISAEDMKFSIADLLRKIQRNGGKSFLTIFLKGDSLADSVLEAQNLSDLGAQLSVDVMSLAELRQDLDGKIVNVSERQKEISLRQSNSRVRKSIVEDQKVAKDEILKQTKSQESLYEQQLEELRARQDEIASVIAQIEDELRAKFDASLLPNKRPGVFEWPVKLVAQGGKGIITQHFGEVSRLYRGKPHNGLDIGVPVGTPIFAGEDGEVLAVDNNDRSTWNKYQYGKYVLIEHGNNLATLYAHLSQQTVSVGQAIKRGELIGYSGNTGYSTGPHLHFGVYWAPSIIMKTVSPAAGLVPIGVAIAPEDYL